MTKTRIALLALIALLVLPGASLAHRSKTETVKVAGLERPIKVLRDKLGVPHVFAKSDHDAYFLVGWLHAQDRLFQMDSTRRQASGTLAELLGSGALASDVQLRTLGLRRAAVRSQAAITPEAKAVLEAYAQGVNAWIAANPLPSEYTALELTKANVPAWTALDSLAVIKLLAFGLSFDDGDIGRTQRLGTYQAVLGPVNGTRLFSEDVMRSEPFAHAPSILPGETSGPPKKKGGDHDDDWSSVATPRTSARRRPRRSRTCPRPTCRRRRRTRARTSGSSPARSRRAAGAMVASDPHLSLGSPATFYEVGVDVDARRGGDLTLYGVTFPGTPSVVHGTNGHVSWGSTVNPTDVTDIYAEQLTIQGGDPGRDHVPGRARADADHPGDVPHQPAQRHGRTTSCPRRPARPRLRRWSCRAATTGRSSASPARPGSPSSSPASARRARPTSSGCSRAPTRCTRRSTPSATSTSGRRTGCTPTTAGTSATRRAARSRCARTCRRARSPALPPYFIRNGTGGNEWITDPTPAEDQATPFELLPFAEMDGLVNPKRGWIANANQDPNGQTFDNDPLNELRPGGGIRYITPGHEDGNRNARVTARLLEETAGRREVSFKEMQSIQADVRLNDAAVLVPYITAALQAAQTPGAPAPLAALAADPKVQEAVARLAAWNFSTPTGIPEGYDASDPRGFRLPPTQAEIDASVAATIYSLWRGRVRWPRSWTARSRPAAFPAASCRGATRR